MYLDYDWVKDYLEDPPSLEAAARAVNETGLETEVEGSGLEIEHTVNRPDAMSHFGLARELSVKLDLSLKHPPVYGGDLPPLDDWQITSADPALCSRYMALLVTGVKATASPPWLVEKLEAIDQTSHNVLVDLTNFLLWEFSHPSHAFDADKLKDRRIEVRMGRAGERLTTLDGRDHGVEGLLAITDASGPIALAGVMGGQNSEVGAETTSLLLELACFNGATVRRSGRNCNIQSDARHRFERGVDREQMERVIRRFVYLLQREQPGAHIVGLGDMDLEPFQRRSIVLRVARLERLLGIALPNERVSAILAAMDCRPQPVPEGWQVAVPGYKVDVEREIDLIEEVIRFAGFGLLKSTLPRFGGTSYHQDPLLGAEQRLRALLVGAGMHETCTYCFQGESMDGDFQLAGEPVRLRNPMSENQAVMRRLILPGLLESLGRNLNRGVSDLALFEIGHTFHGENEPHHLGILMALSKEKNHWWDPPAAHPFYYIKGIFEAIQSGLDCSGLKLQESAPSYLEAGQSQGIWLGDQLLGGLGSLSVKLAEKWGIETPLAALELDLGFLAKDRRPIQGQGSLSPFPGMKIDMAFVLDVEHDFGSVAAFLGEQNPPHLESLELFDHYQGKAVAAGMKSLGFRFRFRAPDRTLTSEEVAATMDGLVAAVKRRFGASVRV